MPSIAIITAHARFPWLRQIAGGKDQIGDWRFTINHIDEDCAFLVVYDDPGDDFLTSLPKCRRMVITSEPPGIKTYRTGYLAQFGVIFGPVGAQIEGTEWQCRHPALPWFYGVGFEPTGLVANETCDSLLAMEPPEKTRAVSVVLSRKSNLPKHRARLELVDYLQGQLGDGLKVFGRGFLPVQDKAEAICPYAYHLVLENNDIPHFWTEKTADALLGWALPIFSGCPDLADDLPVGAFIRTDITSPAAVAAQIKSILDEHPYMHHCEAIRSAREAILTRENLFVLLAQFAASRANSPATGLKMPVLLRRNETFAPFAILAGVRRQAGRLFRTTLDRNQAKE